MNKDVEELKAAVERNMKGKVLNIVLDFGDKYIIGVDEKNKKNGEEVMDPYYAVDKKSWKLSGFSPMMEIDKFKKTIDKPLYLRKRDG